MGSKFSTRQRRAKHFRQRLGGNIALALIVSVPIFPAFGQYMQTYTGVVVRGQYDSSTILASYDWGSGEDTTGLNWEPQFDTTPQTTLLDPSVGEDTSPGVTSPPPPVIVAPKLAPADPKKSLYVTHTVTSGDTLSTIAVKYSVTVAKIRETNELTGDILSLKQKILIPRINGVQYEVKSGDTLSEIAGKFGINDVRSIMLANDLKNYNLRIGRKLLLPNPTKDPYFKPKPVQPSPTLAAKPKPSTPTATSVQPAPVKKPVVTPAKKDSPTITYGDYTLALKTKSCRGFVWGNCTCFVAKYKDVTWRGNAKDWLKNAKKQGKPTGKDPKPGAIIVYHGPGFPPAYGHVGIVMSVMEDSMIVKDMNYRALNEVTTRIETLSNPAILGYIYVD